jgi:UDP-N-acetylglucosamine transferase subunit ALG13
MARGATALQGRCVSRSCLVIFITVGTFQFNALIEKVDAMVANGELHGPVVCQIGSGSYVPGHCEYFRFKPSIDEFIEKASLVICHGGTGSVCSLLASEKPFIAVANTFLADDHQTQFLLRLNRLASFLWTRDLEDLPALIAKSASFVPQTFVGERLSDDLKSYLDSLLLT